MKHGKLYYILALSIILTLLLPVPAIPAHAASGIFLLDPDEGKIGDMVVIDGYAFNYGELVLIYFSSDQAIVGNAIDAAVTAYEIVTLTSVDINGEFIIPYYFAVPDKLTDGQDIEDVHGGDYYFYATYYYNKTIIVAVGKFTVIDGEIELSPTSGTLGTEVQISGQGLRPNQNITAQYDGNDIAIARGDNETDGEGSFTCTILIPESTGGSHVITIIDESGNRPEADFNVETEISIAPTDQAAGEEVIISGTGFGQREAITVTLDGSEVATTPTIISTNLYGSFDGSFLIPFEGVYGPREVAAIDDSHNRAEAQLTVLGGITLYPVTSLVASGYAGMELLIRGASFIVSATVIISYASNDESIPVATVPVDFSGGFLVKFNVPPSPAGSHAITASDGTSTAIATFSMESQPPPIPAPLSPEVTGTAAEEAHFDWEDVDDDSQPITYTLQVASDADFNIIELEREGLSSSEYTLSEEEKLEPTEEQVPYYWRIRAVDGAFNESDWSYPRLFYVGFSWALIPVWVWYAFGGLIALLAGIFGFRTWRKAPRGKK